MDNIMTCIVWKSDNGIPFRCFSNVFPKEECSANDYTNDNEKDDYSSHYKDNYFY